jgi:hypothetical protein
MMPRMDLAFASGILDLGQSPSSFGTTLALLITFLGIGLLVNALVVYIVLQVMNERKANLARMRRHSQ